METEEKKLTSSEIDQMLEEAAAYHVESKEPSNKNKKNNPDRIEMKKYCKFCKKHTLHRETK